MLEATYWASMPTFKGKADLNRRLDWYDELDDPRMKPYFKCSECQEHVFHLATDVEEYLEAVSAHLYTCGT